MSITEYILKLEEIRAEAGDLSVAVYARDETLMEAHPPGVTVVDKYSEGDYPIGKKLVLL